VTGVAIQRAGAGRGVPCRCRQGRRGPPCRLAALGGDRRGVDVLLLAAAVPGEFT
jgi:hypothetical protein